jgi:hypothetical protein
MRVLLPLDPNPIDCVNGLVRAVWKVAFCIYLFIPGILTDKNYLYPPFHGFSRLEHHVRLGNTKYKQYLTLLKAIQGYRPTVSILGF